MGGKAPKAPDPARTAAAQGSWDMSTAQTNAITNNANVVNPYGTTSYSIGSWEDVTTPDGKIIKVPRYTQTQTLSDVGQKQFNSRNALIDQLFGRTSKAPTPGYQTEQLTKDIKLQTDPGLNTNFGYDTGFLKPNEATMATDRSRVERAIMDRANPLLEQNRSSEVARLAAMGLAPGSEKYSRVSDQFEKSANDLAIGATLAGGQEQSRLLDLYNRGLGLSNEARAAGISQSNDAKLAGAGFANNANLAQNEFSNSAKISQTGLNSQARNAGLAEQSNYFNQLMSMLTGQSPGSFASSGFNGFGMQSPDYTGLANNKYQADVNRYNNKMTGIGNVASMALGFL